MFDAIIVGAGPAGVSAAIWLKQLGFDPLTIDRRHQCGGLQITNPYTNTWIATSANAHGQDVADAMHQNMLRHGVQMRLGVEAAAADVSDSCVSVRLRCGERINGRFLILAGGVTPKTGGFARRLGMIIGPGEAVANTNFEGSSVAILGGGDNAFENHGFTKARGARAVTIFARSVKARTELLSRVPPGEVRIGDYTVDADRNLVNGEPFDQILVLYGWEAHKGSLLGLTLAMLSSGLVSTDGDCLTSHPSVYAIGELAGRAHPCCVTAMADGVVAAKAIQRRLEQTAVAAFSGAARRAIGVGARVFA